MISLTCTIPSRSGTFGIPAELALDPKMPNVPSSPSRSIAGTGRQCVKNEIIRLENNNDKRTTTSRLAGKVCNVGYGSSHEARHRS
jgi:hypothetical protein